MESYWVTEFRDGLKFHFTHTERAELARQLRIVLSTTTAKSKDAMLVYYFVNHLESPTPKKEEKKQNG